MRIPSGVTDQYIYFVAVDSTDLKTFETGLASFTVYRSRNGGAAAAFTTPTINETDVTNMPGAYELLLDEDMTIDAGDQSQEVCLRITHAGMQPVTRTFELYRSDVTPGETITVSSGGVVISTGGLASTSFAANAIDSAALAQSAGQEIADEVLNRDLAGGASGNTRNVRNSLRALRNKVSEAGGTLTITQEDDATPAWTATVVRTAATNPITSVDPA